VSEGQECTDEVTISLHLGPVSIQIRQKNTNVGSLLRKCIETTKQHEAAIKELIEIFEGGGLQKSLYLPATSTMSSGKTAMGPKASYQHIVEILDDNVKFVAKNAYSLSNKEAIGLLMYFWNKPLQPKDVEDMLARGWKRTRNVRNYFADERLLKLYVMKEDNGFVLARNGRRWVEEDVLSKLM